MSTKSPPADDPMSIQQRNILVTGGAGYIGSHAVRMLLDAGYAVDVVDNLCRGHRRAVDPRAEFEPLDLRETARLAARMAGGRISAVMHFAGLAYVGESVYRPLDYYRVNVAGTLSLLEAMQSAGVKQLVYSSSCASYGIAAELPIRETVPLQPVNPYGQTKRIVERMLRDCLAGDPEFGFVALRYFNVAGCSTDGRLGEDHRPETHLIPLILQTLLGQREALTVLGSDYPTPDGTCIRDYIHVEDLCQAHQLALEALRPGEGRAYNVGLGRGFSVRQVIAACERVTGQSVPVVYGSRRFGDPDPPELYASADLIRDQLGWMPRLTELDDIIRTAWDWHRRHPAGYG